MVYRIKNMVRMSILGASIVSCTHALDSSLVTDFSDLTNDFQGWTNAYFNASNKESHVHFMNVLRLDILSKLTTLEKKIGADNTKVAQMFKKMVCALHQELKKVFSVLGKPFNSIQVYSVAKDLKQKCSTLGQIAQNMNQNLASMISFAKQEQPDIVPNLAALQDQINSWVASPICNMSAADCLNILRQRCGR